MNPTETITQAAKRKAWSVDQSPAEKLLHAYRARRAAVWYGPVKTTNRAVDAIAAARADVAAGKRRYGAPRTIEFNPANASGERWVENAAPWLRFAGFADELAGRAVDHKGWYADSFQESTYRGAVYLLPGRNGETLAIPGYADPDNKGAAFLDFGNIQRDSDPDEAKRSAALAADDLAKRYAESAREYDIAWQAGSQWAARGEEIAADRQRALRLLAERRAAKANGAEFPTICSTILGEIESIIEAIREARAERESLASGNGIGRDYSLSFYPSPELKAAFNEGAGEEVLA